MKAALLTGPGKFEIHVLPDPKIKNDTDVLIRIKTVGVCGSDIHYYTTGRIGSQIVQYPFTVGHETAGVVEGVGKDVKRLKRGDRIAIDPAVSCGKCDQCKAGRENTCRELRFLGAPKQLDGAQCEYIVLPERNCFPIGEDMTFDQAALTEPLAIALYAVEKSALSDGADAAILGAGPIGMSVFHVLRTKNVGKVFVTDKIDARVVFSKKLNPSWSGNPDKEDVVKEILRIEPLQMDVVFECSGDQEAIGQSVELVKPGGKLVIVGIPERDEISFLIHELRRKEITIINVRRQLNSTQRAIDLVAAKRINVDPLVTHRFPLEKAQDAFELVSHRRDGVMKTMIFID
ncbi:MAG TPA: alcohol dehydrogenase catalytic domain-containing protein [Candidatus Kryptonia bacterium]